MNRHLYYIVGVMLSLVIFALPSCSNEKPSNDTITPEVEEVILTPEVEEVILTPNFSSDSAYYYVEKQVGFGPRVPNTLEHNKCGVWLADELRRHGAEVIVQPALAKAFDGKILELKNIVGQYNLEAKSRVMLYAHWDTRPFADKDTVRTNEPIDGANDGGSGVGILLEIARQFSIKAPSIGVDIVFFDGEDYGSPEGSPSTNTSYLYWCLGSQEWAKQPHKYGYRARFGILLDMVGAKDAVFNKEGTSMKYAPNIVSKIWSRAAKLGHGKMFSNRETPPTIDDNLFVSELGGVPSANIVDYRMQVIPMGYGPFHHTHGDNMSIIDKGTLQAVGETVLSVVYSE